MKEWIRMRRTTWMFLFILFPQPVPRLLGLVQELLGKSWTGITLRGRATSVNHWVFGLFFCFFLTDRSSQSSPCCMIYLRGVFECVMLNVAMPHSHETFTFDWLTDWLTDGIGQSAEVSSVTVIVTLYAHTNAHQTYRYRALGLLGQRACKRMSSPSHIFN
jgi:hypothetical protein